MHVKFVTSIVTLFFGQFYTSQINSGAMFSLLDPTVAVQKLIHCPCTNNFNGPHLPGKTEYRVHFGSSCIKLPQPCCVHKLVSHVFVTKWARKTAL